MSNILIAYYSRADENYVSGQLRVLEKGNTEAVAEQLAALTGGDLFRIEQKRPYAAGYNDCIEQAREDQKQDARPELKQLPENPDGYDTVLLGYPNYWGTLPMAVFTFLEAFDFTGKRILPFCTHEGSGLGNSLRDIRRLAPGAKLADGLAIHGSRVAASRDAVAQWVRKNLK